MNTQEMKAEAARERELARERAEQRLINAYHRAFATEDGRAVLEDLEGVFRLEGRVFTPVRTSQDAYAYDPLTAALADGGRAVLIYIQERLAAKVRGDGNVEEAAVTVGRP